MKVFAPVRFARGLLASVGLLGLGAPAMARQQPVAIVDVGTTPGCSGPGVRLDRLRELGSGRAVPAPDRRGRLELHPGRYAVSVSCTLPYDGERKACVDIGHPDEYPTYQMQLKPGVRYTFRCALKAGDLVYRIEETSLSAVTYKTVKYAILTYAKVDEEEVKSSIEWSYPIVVWHPNRGLPAINDWIRARALEDLAECAALPLEALRGLSDNQVVETISKSQQCGEVALSQSVLTLGHAFGDYLSFARNIEYLGQARPQHGVGVQLLDVRTGQTLSTGDLFKPGALDELNGRLAAQIAAQVDQRPECTGRAFDWSQAGLVSPQMLGIDYPYNPAEWARCGDGVEVIEGPQVTRLLKASRRLQPGRKLIELP